MPTILSQLDAAFRNAIRKAFQIDADPLLAPSQNDKFGDYQSNAAMSLAKQLGKKPREVAEQIKSSLELGEIASETSIAGPGFINVRLSPQWLAEQLKSSPWQSAPLAASRTRTVVDYSGPNIAKQMHVGNLRSTIIGDAIARVLAFAGHDVIRQNHLGDWGTQFGRVVLAMWYEAVFTRTDQRGKLEELMNRVRTDRSGVVQELAELHQKFVDQDADGTRLFLPFLKDNNLTLDDLDRAYAFVSIVTDAEEAQQVSIRHPLHDKRTLAELPRLVTRFIQNPDVPENEQERLAWETARKITLHTCAEIYTRLGVQLADASLQPEPMERGESFYNSMLPAVVEDLKKLGLARESEGAIVVAVPGYENPLIIQKADGGYLYGTTDLAAIRFRVSRLHANEIVYLVDARQSQHFAQVFWTARKAHWADNTQLEHAAFGTMLGEDGRPFKTRSGDSVKLKDLLDEAEERAFALVTDKDAALPEAQRQQIAHAVGIGAVKYADLSKDRTSDYVFSWEKMLSFDGNTAPYLQNAYVRIRSIFRKSGTGNSPESSILLETPHELALAKHVLRFGEVIEIVARELKPHHLTNYLFELATRFHAFYEHCPVLQSEAPTRSSRLALCDVTAKTLAQGLELLGIEHPEQM